jgi:hypothetical protein
MSIFKSGDFGGTVYLGYSEQISRRQLAPKVGRLFDGLAQLYGHLDAIQLGYSSKLAMVVAMAEFARLKAVGHVGWVFRNHRMMISRRVYHMMISTFVPSRVKGRRTKLCYKRRRLCV